MFFAQIELNFGHGEKRLRTVLATLMMLAFLIDQVQKAACSLPLSGQGDFIKKDLTLTEGCFGGAIA